MSRVTFNDKLKVIDETGSENKKYLRQEKKHLQQQLNIILGLHRETRSKSKQTQQINWGTKKEIEERLKQIEKELSKPEKGPRSRLNQFTSRVLNTNRTRDENPGENTSENSIESLDNNTDISTREMAESNRTQTGVPQQFVGNPNDQTLINRQFTPPGAPNQSIGNPNDQNPTSRQFTPPGVPHQSMSTLKTNMDDNNTPHNQTFSEQPPTFGSHEKVHREFTEHGNEWGGAKRKTQTNNNNNTELHFEQKPNNGINEFELKHNLNHKREHEDIEEQKRRAYEQHEINERARQYKEWVREQREQRELHDRASREREERFRMQMHQMEEQARLMKEELTRTKERENMLRDSLNDFQRQRCMGPPDIRHAHERNQAGNTAEMNIGGNDPRGNWFDPSRQQVESQIGDQSQNMMMQLLIQMGRLQEQMANTQITNSQMASSRNDNRNNRNSSNGARDTFVRKLRQMPNFSGESLQKLKDFIQIGDLFMEECLNETERDEFYFQVKYNLRGEARDILQHVQNDWYEIRNALKERFTHLADRDIINSKLENLHQERKETLQQFAERARKTLMEKNSSYDNISEEQREDHNRTARRAFIKGIQEKKIRDRMSIRGASSLESAISSALEMENETRYDVPEKEMYCLNCNRSGHRERDCRQHERSKDIAGQIAKALGIKSSNKNYNNGQYKNFKERKSVDYSGNTYKNSETNNQHGNNDNRNGNGNRNGGYNNNGGNRQSGKTNGQQQNVFVNEEGSGSSQDEDDSSTSSASSASSVSSEKSEN
ncbi:histone-lysine N-methyltransferase, H3 lysine-79 specific-like [Sitodiplosis mosellana]|uniref:histone-lysine N-methyltransferase, H3 lysine-79 specific-like n=1 Tax=Sitodiplosis mosellana TaxID=263140 RepID=UPI0024448E0D|nr:histone-lysine N-methyltransferase, H3 lysine-79 specific-like [Sitodiplosis mosellana]